MYFIFSEAMVFIMRVCMRKVTVSFVVPIPPFLCIRNVSNRQITWNFIFGIFNAISTQISLRLMSDISNRHSGLPTLVISRHD